MTPDGQAIIMAIIVGAIAIIKDWQGYRQIERINEHNEKMVSLLTKPTKGNDGESVGQS